MGVDAPSVTTTVPVRPCPGPCNRRWRAAETRRLQTGGPHDLQAWEGEPVWCGRDTARVATALTALPALIASIHAEAVEAPQWRAAGERVTSSHVPAFPGQGPILMADELTREVLHWEDKVRRARGFTPAPGWETGERTSREACHFLTGSLDWMLTVHPKAADPEEAPGVALLHLHHRGETFLHGRPPQPEQMTAPCPAPQCEMWTLTKLAGDPWIRCGDPACGRTLSEAEYDQWARRWRVYYVLAPGQVEPDREARTAFHTNPMNHPRMSA